MNESAGAMAPLLLYRIWGSKKRNKRIDIKKVVGYSKIVI